MWIDQIDIAGFGRLGGSYRLGRGLTVVIGDNEAGKSTLHEALVRSLFGFARLERRRQPGGPSVRDRFAPWTGQPFALTATVEDRRGRRLRIEWEFAGHSVALFDLGTGEELSAEVRGKGDEVSLGRYLAEIDLAEYRQVYCLDQGDVDAVTRSDNLLAALQAASETGGDQGVDAALALLGEFLHDQLGVHASQLRPLPSGRLADARERAAELAGQLDRCRGIRREADALAARLRALRTDIESLQRERVAVEQDLLRAAASAAERKLDDARRLAASASVPVEAARRVSDASEAAIRARFGALEQAAVALRQAREEAEAVGDQVAALEREHGELALRAQALEPFERADTRLEGRLRELAGQWRAARAERGDLKPPASPPADPLLARYRDRRVAMGRIDQRSRSRLLLVAGSALAVAGLVLAAVAVLGGGRALAAPLVGAAIAALAAGAAVSVWRLAAGRRLAVQVAELGASSIAQLDQRLQNEERSIARAEILADQHRQRALGLSNRIADLEGRMAQALDEAEAEGRGFDGSRLETYFEAAGQARERREVLAALESNRRQFAEVTRPIKELESRRAAVASLERELLSALRATGVEAGHPSDGMRRFDEATAADRADLARRQQAESAASALAATLDGDTLETLEDRLARARSRLADHEAAAGRRTSGETDPTRLTSRLDELGGLIRAAEIEAASIEPRVADRDARAGDPAALEEELAGVNARVDRIELIRDAVALARGALRDAAREAHRRIAPRLNAALARNLPLLTSGRYREAIVGDDLSIQVVAPESGRLVPADRLSRGTRDQIYFVQRLEMARLLDAATGGLPLLLDDPFARFDAVRLRQAVSLLAEWTRDRQAVLFSEDRTLVALIGELVPQVAVIELPAPDASGRL